MDAYPTLRPRAPADDHGGPSTRDSPSHLLGVGLPAVYAS